MSDRATLIDKIQKLLALSESSNEHEAALAAAKVQEMLTRYNVQQDELRGRSEKTEEVVEIVITYSTPGGRRNMTDVDLATTIARGLFCEVIHTSYRMWIIGKKGDAEIVERVFKSLSQKLIDLAMTRTAEYTASLKARYGVTSLRDLTIRGASHPKTWRNAWMVGAIQGVGVQFRKQAKASKEELGSQVTAMISLRGQEIQTYLKEKHPHVTAYAFEITGNAAAQAQGYKDGLTITPDAGRLQG